MLANLFGTKFFVKRLIEKKMLSQIENLFFWQKKGENILGCGISKLFFSFKSYKFYVILFSVGVL